MRTRVYIETTIPSFYFTLRNDPESVARMHWIRRWWDRFAGEFNLLTSDAVIAELSRGVGEKTDERIALVDSLELLEITGEVEEIAAIYIEKLVAPNDPSGDALHLALRRFTRPTYFSRGIANTWPIRIKWNMSGPSTMLWGCPCPC
jgi:predicted nucleic acid-binding protein